ncbi:MAG: CvpA family protein [Xanthobacteraceae bacterium]|jgi:membrane protein required for colicin V production
MPLDIVLIVIMLISGLLAMVRGFMREVLSIVAWALAAGAAVYAALRLSYAAKAYFSNLPEMAVVAGVAIVAFLLTLIVVSVITVRISDMILDSRVGALDRTLGFLFGLARGFFIVVVAFIFFAWLVPDKGQPRWVTSAKSQVVLKAAGEKLKDLFPDDMDTYLSRLLRKRPKGDEQEQPESAPDQHSQRDKPADGRAEAGYDRSSRAGMQQLLEVRGMGALR